MTDISDISEGEDHSPHILKAHCGHIRGQLHASLTRGFEQVSTDLLPILVGGSRILQRAAEVNWKAEHISDALHEVTALEALCRKVERMLRCYQDTLAAIDHVDADSPGTPNESPRACSDL